MNVVNPLFIWNTAPAGRIITSSHCREYIRSGRNSRAPIVNGLNGDALIEIRCLYRFLERASRAASSSLLVRSHNYRSAGNSPRASHIRMPATAINVALRRIPDREPHKSGDQGSQDAGLSYRKLAGCEPSSNALATSESDIPQGPARQSFAGDAAAGY